MADHAGGGGGGNASVVQQFRVELDRLRATAQQLQAHVDALRGSAEEMGANPNFGDPNVVGASRLAPKHQQIIGPTQQLISDIRGGIAAGEEALRIVAARYAEADAVGAEKLDRAVQRALDEEGFQQDPDYPGGRMMYL